MDLIKNNLKKIIMVIIVLALGTTFYVYTSQCKIDGSAVCYNSKTETFKIEEDASIIVQVENEALGAYLVETWDNLHPDNQGAVSYLVEKPLNLTQLADNFETDVIITSSNNAAYVLNDVFDLGKDVRKTILTRSAKGLENVLNERGNFFIPNSVTGWTFAYNKTMLEDLGFDLIDENNNGLPDVFETWEQLFELDDQIFEDLDILFPLSFKDQYSFYPFLTSGKWHLNFTDKGDDAGISHPEFLKGLEFIEVLGQANLYKEKHPASDLQWQYNTAFFESRTAFTLMSDWMNFAYFQEKTKDEYIIAPLPSYKESTLRPKGEVDGYLVSKDTLYPSASAEAIRILRSPEAFEFYNGSKTFVYHRNYLEELEASDKEINLIRALNFIDPDPVMVLESAPTVLARTFFYEVDFMDILEALYEGNIDATEAQSQIVERHDAWLLKISEGTS